MAQKKITDLSLRSSVDTTCNFPVDDSTQTFRVTGTQVLDFVKSLTSHPDQIKNLTITSSVGSSALTLAVKTFAGSNASSTDPIVVGMRSSTLTSGLYLNRSITSALSLVISSGSTLGQVSAQPSTIYVYLIDNAGSLELAASHAYYPEDSLVTTVAEGGAGAADSSSAIYSTTLRSSVPIRLIATILNTQSTAGTWASAGTKIQLQPADYFKPPTIQKVTAAGAGTYVTPAGVKYLRVRMVGAGGGGGGSGTTAGTSGGTGTATTFGTALLSAGGGVGGTVSSTSGGGAGGASSLGSAIGTALPGGYGGNPGQASSTSNGFPGGMGGSSALGGGGSNGGGGAGTAGIAAAANTGGGGGGGGTSITSNCIGGGGGGSGGFVDAIISGSLLDASFPYVVGAKGSLGTAGTSGFVGGAGSDGYLEITEMYN